MDVPNEVLNTFFASCVHTIQQKDYSPWNRNLYWNVLKYCRKCCYRYVVIKQNNEFPYLKAPESIQSLETTLFHCIKDICNTFYDCQKVHMSFQSENNFSLHFKKTPIILILIKHAQTLWNLSCKNHWSFLQVFWYYTKLHLI